MGKIFGIADLPVSTIMTPFEPMHDFRPPYEDEIDDIRKMRFSNIENKADTFVSKTANPKANPIIRMRNGFGKLMKHFSIKL